MMKFFKKVAWQLIFFVLSLIGAYRLPWSKNKLLVLTYHRVLPENDRRIHYEQPGMYVTDKTFEMHLKLIKKYFTVVPLGEWLAKAKAGESVPDKACAVTFDDGWQDNYAYAFPLLEKYNIPATIFVVASFIGSSKDFWPGRLAQLISTIALSHDIHNYDVLKWLDRSALRYAFLHKAPSPAEFDEIICYCKQYSDEQNHAHIDQAWARLGDNGFAVQEQQNRVTLNAAELQTMVDSGLVNIGSHTCNHIRLQDGLDDKVLYDEVTVSKCKLQQQFPASQVELFCYPNGDYSKKALHLVEQQYQGACTTVRGWNDVNSSRYLLKRISVHDSMTNTPKRFLAKISGWI